MDVVHFLSKAFWFLASPGNIVLVVLVICMALLGLRRLAPARLGLGVLVLVLGAILFLPIHEWVARPLENRFVAAPVTEAPTGLIVLGGFANGRIIEERNSLAVGQAAERLMAATALAVRYPTTRVIVTGRDNPPAHLLDWFSSFGIATARVTFAPTARNTYEDALLGKRLVQPSSTELWLLITSAQHMPRAVGVFRRVGWSVVAYPVDYRSGTVNEYFSRLDLAQRLVDLASATKEWIGLLAYYVLGRTGELLPGPVSPTSGS